MLTSVFWRYSWRCREENAFLSQSGLSWTAELLSTYPGWRVGGACDPLSFTWLHTTKITPKLKMFNKKKSSKIVAYCWSNICCSVSLHCSHSLAVSLSLSLFVFSYFQVPPVLCLNFSPHPSSTWLFPHPVQLSSCRLSVSCDQCVLLTLINRLSHKDGGRRSGASRWWGESSVAL